MRVFPVSLPGRLLAVALLLAPAAPAAALDLNSATAAQLRELKGLGPAAPSSSCTSAKEAAPIGRWRT